tara:strand:+ start:91 stop:342 length:252 start_codon:yes stop_codon:yes gene_type:complete
MRYIKDIPNNQFKIGLFNWNNKYIIKIESGMYEQIYKIDAYEIDDESELARIFDDTFIKSVKSRFEMMHSDCNLSLKRNEIMF